MEKLIRDQADAAEVEAALREWPACSIRWWQRCGRLASPSPQPPPPAADTPPVDPALTREAADQLTKLLEDFDPAAVEFIEANRTALQAFFPPMPGRSSKNLLRATRSTKLTRE